jgi:hypothetical protein
MRGKARIAAIAAALQIAAPAGLYAMTGDGAHRALLAGPTILEEGVTSVKLRSGLGLRTAARATLVIENIAFDAPPGVLYEVHLQARSGRRAPVGVINFYNQTAPGYNGSPGGPVAGATQSFDATDALRALGGEPTFLLFEPSAGVTGPNVKARANAAAHVRFGSATIKLQ